jgi:hypothetical protein
MRELELRAETGEAKSRWVTFFVALVCNSHISTAKYHHKLSVHEEGLICQGLHQTVHRLVIDREKKSMRVW